MAAVIIRKKVKAGGGGEPQGLPWWSSQRAHGIFTSRSEKSKKKKFPAYVCIHAAGSCHLDALTQKTLVHPCAEITMALFHLSRASFISHASPLSLVPAHHRYAGGVKMPRAYRDNPIHLGGEGTLAPTLDAMEAAAVLFQRVQRDRLRGRLVIAPRVHLPIIANEIEQSSLNLWRFVVFLSSTVGLLVLISFQMNPALFNDMRNSDGSLFRGDWSARDAIIAAVDSVEHDGVGSSFRDVETTDDLWDWLEEAVEKLYDDTATIGGYNKEIAHLDIIQERRNVRKCDSRLKANVHECFMDYNKGADRVWSCSKREKKEILANDS
jgi:hypothetical protein